MMHLLYPNAETLQTLQVRGYHNQIGLIINLTMYTTLSNKVWAVPVNPRVCTMVLTTSTSAHQEQLQK